MGLFDKFKNIVLGMGGDSSTAVDLTNQEIMNIIVKRFEEEIKLRSVGQRMIYPMTFTIVMHNNDFQGRMVEFQLFIPEVVNEFYKIIIKYKEKHNDYTNPANYWTFRFIPSMSEEMELDGKDIHVEEGKIVIIASILDETETNDGNKSLNVSMPVDKTGIIKKVNINLAAFGKFVGTDEPITVTWINPEEDINGVNVSPLAALPFALQPKNPVGSSEKSRPQPGFSSLDAVLNGFGIGNTSAKLAYKLDGQLYTYEINSNECWVCGEGAENGKPDIFIVKTNKINNPHLLIRKDTTDGKYYVAAFAPSILETIQLPVSTPEKPKWTQIEKDVNIIMNGFVVRFIKKN